MISYPFIPKTTERLQPGDFWGIALDDGRYAAGLVLQVLNKVTILGAVLDWSNDQLPTAASIASSKILAAGRMHIRAIEQCGPGICGKKRLALDGSDIPLFRSHAEGAGQRLLQGATDVGPATEADKHLPVLSTWGFSVPRIRANLAFCRHP